MESSQDLSVSLSLEFRMSGQHFTVFNWNARGLNTPARREAVRGMVQAVRPMIVCLQETKLQQITSQTLSEILGPNLDGF
jgi:hypothetical protein